MTTDREFILEAIQKVVGGTPLNRYTRDTIYAPGRCAQNTREIVEGGLGIPENTWEVAVLAHEYRKMRQWPDRWASDYEQAARKLGLNKPATEMVPGDILFWAYRAKDGNNYGHVAPFVGGVPGLGPCVLENTDWDPVKRVEMGAQQPLGKGTRIFLTPLRLLGTPTTVITPTLAILKAEQTPPPPTGPAIPAGWEQLYSPDMQIVPGEWVNVVRRGSEFRVVKVPAYKVKQAGLS